MRIIRLNADSLLTADAEGYCAVPGTRNLISALKQNHIPFDWFTERTAETKEALKALCLNGSVFAAENAGPENGFISYENDKWTLKSCGMFVEAPTVYELLSRTDTSLKPAKGFFLSVEGPDGSGKTTQINFLKKKLQRFGFDVLHTREPGGTPISEKIRGILLDPENREMDDITEAILYSASRAQHVAQLIRPALAQGRLVLCDRFVDSSVAYQGGGRQLGVDRILNINQPAVNGTMPNVTLYLKIDAESALKRRLSASAPDRLESEAVSFHVRVQEGYEQLIAREPERFVIVNAAAAPYAVAAEAWEKLSERILDL